MPINKVNKGDLITSSAWNSIVDEINLKANRTGDFFSGAVTITTLGTGKLTVDSLIVTNPVPRLTVDNLTVSNVVPSLTVNSLTVLNQMSSLTVATAAVDTLTVKNPVSDLKVTQLTVTNAVSAGSLTVTNVVSSGSLTASNATLGTLYVSSHQTRSLSFGWLNGGGSTGRSSGTFAYSIIAEQRIAASEFNAFSDARIKQNLHLSNPTEDLATLMQLKVTDYTMIDTVTNGNRVSKKLIAQEVATVYPNAVSYATSFIPNIYQLAEIENGFVTLSNPDLAIGDKVRLIFEEQQMELQVSERNENGFSVVADSSKSKLPDGAVFVFGKEVDDFHSIDYDAITMLNTSATQAVVKQINGLETKHAALKARFEALETSLKSVQS